MARWPQLVSVCFLGTSRISELLLFSARPVLALPGGGEGGVLILSRTPGCASPGLWSSATSLPLEGPLGLAVGGETGACSRSGLTVNMLPAFSKHRPASLCRQEPGWGRNPVWLRPRPGQGHLRKGPGRALALKRFSHLIPRPRFPSHARHPPVTPQEGQAEPLVGGTRYQSK